MRPRADRCSVCGFGPLMAASSRTGRRRYSRSVDHAPPVDDARIAQGLRERDESVFAMLMREYNASLLRVAQIYVTSRAVAEEVVQETWLAVLNGIDRFEARSSLKTWIFRILTNIAKTRAQREGRTLPFSALERPDAVPEPAVGPERFLPPEHERWPGHWASKPEPWPEERLLAGETREIIERAIEQLPPSQRAVISLRDVEGWSSDETRNALGLTETNQRVLLHRARSKVRQALEDYFSERQ
jgi:RNA polymerase sigma-70 factor, ECF subfamily